MRTRILGVCAERGGLSPAVGNGACSGHVELHHMCLEMKGCIFRNITVHGTCTEVIFRVSGCGTQSETGTGRKEKGQGLNLKNKGKQMETGDSEGHIFNCCFNGVFRTRLSRNVNQILDF